MKKPKISLSLLNSSQMLACLTGDDGMDSVDICQTAGQGPDGQRKCCDKAAKVLRELAEKFEVLGGMADPAKSKTQDQVNKEQGLSR
jgi:hypothetical protein